MTDAQNIAVFIIIYICDAMICQFGLYVNNIRLAFFSLVKFYDVYIINEIFIIIRSNSMNTDETYSAFQVEERIKRVIASSRNMKDDEAAKLTGESAFDQLGDSLDTVEVIMAIEDEFEIKISDTDLENLKIISDLTAYVMNQKNEDKAS